MYLVKEIGEGLRRYPNIKFYYFETRVEEDQLIFSYHLKEGISNDRLGYLILKREGVVNMLQNLWLVYLNDAFSPAKKSKKPYNSYSTIKATK